MTKLARGARPATGRFDGPCVLAHTRAKKTNGGNERQRAGRAKGKTGATKRKQKKVEQRRAKRGNPTEKSEKMANQEKAERKNESET